MDSSNSAPRTRVEDVTRNFIKDRIISGIRGVRQGVSERVLEELIILGRQVIRNEPGQLQSAPTSFLTLSTPITKLLLEPPNLSNERDVNFSPHNSEPEGRSVSAYYLVVPFRAEIHSEKREETLYPA